MKRTDFIALVESGAAELGLRRSPFKPMPTVTILCGSVGGLATCAGIEFSVRRDSRVTASWFVGATVQWAYVPRDVPRHCYRRASTLLTAEERKRFGTTEATPDVSELWWSPADAVAAKHIATLIVVTLPRFLEAAPLAEIRRSKDWAGRKTLCRAVAAQVGERPTFASLAEPDALNPWLAAATNALELEENAGRDGARLAKELAEEAALSSALELL